MFALILAACPQVVTDTLLRDMRTDFSGLVQDTAVVDLGALPDGRRLFQARSESDEFLWVTDGTPAGTLRLEGAAGPFRGAATPAPQTPGFAPAQPPQSASLPDGRIVYRGFDDAAGAEPWVTDGTPAGTFRLADVTGNLVVQNLGFQRLGSEVVTLVPDGAGGWDLIATDGTTAGTRVAIDDLNVPFGLTVSTVIPKLGSSGSELVLLFATFAGQRLISSDGTAAGTFDRGVVTGANGRGLGNFAVGGVVPFGATNGLRAYDPATASVVTLSTGGSLLWGHVVGNRLFAALRSGSPLADILIVTDGTIAGTQTLSTQGLLAGINFALTELNGGLFFAGLGPDGYEPWFTDGTPAGTVQIADINPGAGGSFPQEAGTYGGEAYFYASDPATGFELWRTDGTAAGTQLVRDYNPGASSSVIDGPFVSTPQGLVFLRDDPPIGLEPHVTQGTVASTKLLAEFAPQEPGSSDPRSLVRVGERVFFSATDNLHGNELWATDGTAAGTVMVSDIVSGIQGSSPRDLFEFDGRLFFTAFDTFTNRELYTSDGTSGGTFLLEDLSPGPLQSFASGFVVAESQFFLQAAGDVWRSDGTPSGTYALDGLNPASSFVEQRVLGTLGDSALVFASAGGTLLPNIGRELYLHDGTPGGLTLLLDALPGAGSYGFGGGVSNGELALVRLEFGGAGVPNALFVTDGTPAGTQPIASLGYTGSTAFELLGAANSALFFRDGTDMWATDGTSAGTQIVGSLLNLGPNPLFRTDGDLAHFLRFAGPDVTALWQSDGTPVGTYSLGQIEPPAPLFEDGLLLGPAGTEGAFLYAEDGPLGGVEPWISAGLPGTRRALADSAPGTLDSDPGPMVRLGDQLLYAADDGTNGRELHAIPFAATEASLVEAFGVGCSNAGLDHVLKGDGPAVLGGAIDLGLSESAPGSVAALFYSSSIGALDAGAGCTLYLLAPVFLTTVALDGSGAGAVTIGLPSSPALVGLPLGVQAAVGEPGGPFGGLVGLSSALEVIVGS